MCISLPPASPSHAFWFLYRASYTEHLLTEKNESGIIFVHLGKSYWWLKPAASIQPVPIEKGTGKLLEPWLDVGHRDVKSEG